jgi:hypothetical protein
MSIEDFRGQGPPADIGTFQSPCSIIVYQYIFSGTVYYVAARQGDRGWVLVDYGTVALTVLQAAVTALPATGGVIHINPPFSADGQLTIARSNVTIETGLALMRADYAADDCYIRQIRIDATAAAVQRVVLQGLQTRELHFLANGHEIRHIEIIQTAVLKDATYHGVIFEGDGAVTGWLDQIQFWHCSLIHTGGSDGATWGLISFVNQRLATEITFDTCEFAGYLSTQTYFYIDGASEVESLNIITPRVYTTGGVANIRFVFIRLRTAAGYATGAAIKILGGRFELHTPMTLIEDSGTSGVGSSFLNFNVRDVTFDIDDTFTLTAANLTNTSWTAFGRNNEVNFVDNHTRGLGTFSWGTLPAPSATMKSPTRLNNEWCPAPEILLFGSFIVGRYVDPGSVTGATTPTTFPANLLIGHLICVPRKMRFDRLGVRVNVAGAAGARGRLGLYNVDPDTFYPTSLIVDAGEFDATVPGAVELVINQTLERGWYLACFIVNDATIGFRVALHGITPLGGVLGYERMDQGWSVAQAYGPLPANYPEGGSLYDMRNVQLRLAELL